VKSKWLILFLIWLMMMVAYFDRINLPVAGSSIMESLHISKTQLSLVLSAFTLGYGFMQAPGGHFADRFGSRSLLIVAIVVWSVFTGLTGLAASLAMMVGVRVVFGIGEGLENGAQYKLIGENFLPKERALANSIFLSALALGPALGTPFATWLIANYGWREMFFIFALLGLVVGVVIVALLPDDRRKALDPVAQAIEKENRDSGFADAIRRPTSWLCAAGYLLFNAAFWGFLSWVPTYLKEDRHIPLVKSGVLGALPYVAGFIGMMLSGYLGSSLLSHRRAYLVAACYLGTACGLLIALSATSVTNCMIGLCVGGFFLYGGFGPFWAIAIGLAPPKARGVFTGSVNCCGQIGAFSSQIIIGVLAERMKSFSGAILFMVGALLLATVVMTQLQRLLNSEEGDRILLAAS